MNVTSIKLHNSVFKQNSTNALENKANKLAIEDARTDEFISSKNNTRDDKKNNTWKWLLGGVITAALIIGLYIEKKTANAAKAEKEAVEKAKKELEERFAKEKEELEKKLKEEKKKWDDFFKNNPTNNEKKALPSNNSASSNNTNLISGNSSELGSYSPSQDAKNPRQSVNTQSIHTDNQDLQEKIQRTQNYEFKVNLLNMISATKEPVGPNSIIGYAKEKQFITDKLISPILENRENDILNMFILYGPKGTGKTYAMNAFINDLTFNRIPIENQINSKDNFLQLTNAVKQAEENYQKNGKRSFIYLDEIDEFFNFNDIETFEAYKNIIENLSRNHATFIGTTNYPQRINPEILSVAKCEKLYFPPIQNEELPTYIEHCTRGLVEDSVNYQELAQIIINNLKGGACSNDRIGVTIRSAAKKVADPQNIDIPARLLNQQDLAEVFKNMDIDISKEVIDSYKPFIEKEFKK